MMRRTNPFAEFETWFERMNEQLAETGRFDGNWMRSSDFAVDVAEDDAEIVVTADLPGFEKADIDVSVAERTLTIRAEHDLDEEHDAGAYHRRERRHHSVHRSIALPADVVADDASASYRNGVLAVTLPRRESDDEDARHIDVE